jgi:hypothetical protein
MTTFLDWYNDPDVAEERRDIQRHLRCTEADAVVILKLDAIADRLEMLELAGEWITEDEEDDEEPPLGV